jgi:hypothetical protein
VIESSIAGKRPPNGDDCGALLASSGMPTFTHGDDLSHDLHEGGPRNLACSSAAHSVIVDP